MAYMCVQGNGECDGCQRCRIKADSVGNCEQCSDVIFEDEDY